MTDVPPNDPITDETWFVDNLAKLRCAEVIELVTDYLDDALDARALADFQTHLAGCDGCSLFVDEVSMTIQLMGLVGGNTLALQPPRFDELLVQLAARVDKP